MTAIAVLSALVLAWYLLRAVLSDRCNPDDCGYGSTPQGVEHNQFQQWDKELSE